MLSSEDRARQIFQRLTGTGLLDNDPRFTTMVSAVNDGRMAEAARVATGDRNFYGVVLRNWSAPFSTMDGAIDAEFDDLQALALGLVRDDLDARLLLTGNLHYEGNGVTPAYSEASNDHFKAMEDQAVDLGRVLVRKEGPGIASPEYAGVLTTRGFAKAYYDAGTNRRPVVAAMNHFLCTPQSSWRDPNLPERFIRRDVHRDPTPNYLNECRTCHAGMDGMSGAFAHFDFEGGKAKYFGPFNIAPKYKINQSAFPDGFLPSDDEWENFANRHHNVALGWKGAVRGKGIQAYGQMLANSDAFARCIVKTAFQATCRRASVANDKNFLDTTTTAFVDGGYKLRTLFEKVAINAKCE